MKPQFTFIALSAFMAFAVVSCGKQQQTAQPQAQQPTQQQPTGPITVKGFYIGMSEDEFRQVGKTQYGWTKGGNVTETTAVNQPDATDLIQIDYPDTDGKAGLDDLPAQFVFDTTTN
jgi:hypothetical protein